MTSLASSAVTTGTRVRYTGPRQTDYLHTGDEGTVVRPRSSSYTMNLIRMDNRRSQRVSYDGDVEYHWMTSGNEFDVIDMPAPAEDVTTYTEAEVHKIVADAIKERNRVLGQAIWEAKVQNNLCSEVERFMEDNDMAHLIPRKIKVEVITYALPEEEGQADWRLASSVADQVRQAVESAGIDVHDVDSEVEDDY